MGLPETAEAWEAAILLVDKPKHWTSFDVCGKLRVLLTEPGSSRKRRRKVGHAGTLDPLATGLLIVCVGKATKAVESLMGMDKEYSGVLRLGESTPSYDAGTPVNRQLPWEDITDEEMQAAAQALTGDISQVPPMFSAIKVAGKRLYDLARKGRELELQPRAVRVDEFSVWRDSPGSQDVNYRIRCSKGCYVRSLVRDLGDALGSAAYVKTLCRDAIGGFRLSQAWSMDALVEGLTEQKLLYWPRPPRRQDGPLKAADGALPSTTHDNC